MTPARRARRLLPPDVGGVSLLAGLALFVGLASAVLPPWFLFSVLLIPAVAALLLVRPEYGLTALVALVCGLIHPALVPRLPLLGGSVSAPDATLLMLAACAVWMLATGAQRAPAAPVPGERWLAVALGLFGVSFVVAIGMSLGVREVNPTWVLGEARRLLYLLTLPIALVILRPQERQRRFVVSLVVLGCLFAVGQVLQGVFNLQVFGEKGRMVVLETMGRQDHGTTRSLTLGIEVIVFALLLTVGGYLVGRVRASLFLGVTGLLLIGIFLSFGRTTFVVVGLCVAMIVAWLNLRKLPQLAGLLLLVVAVAGGAVALWKPQTLAAAVYRMTSIDAEVASGDSAQWRIWEAEEMLPHIQRHPLAGIGLGADYKTANRSSVDSDLNRYVHNAYLYMGGKMGLPALAFFLAAMGAIFAIGRRSARSQAPPRVRVVGAAGAAMMVNFALASVTEPHFMVDYSLVLIALAGALVVLAARDRPVVAAARPAAPRPRRHD